MKINNFRGGISDISAKTATLMGTGLRGHSPQEKVLVGHGIQSHNLLKHLENILHNSCEAPFQDVYSEPKLNSKLGSSKAALFV